VTSLYKIIAKRFPDLRLKLAQARIYEPLESYIQKTVMLSVMLGGGLSLVLFSFSKSFLTFLLFPLLALVLFFYFIHRADAKISAIQKQISREIVFAGRFLIVELDSGVPMYTAFQNMGRNYETIGRYFNEIVQRVDLGTSMEESLNEAVQLAPSNDLRRLFWQILNSLKTGGEVGSALSSVVDQIVREQQILVKEYGRKLNPLAMFYMMIAIIIPSLGTIMLIVLSTFIGIQMGFLLYSLILLANILMQFMFLSIIKAQRPPVDI
jgi:archaeal flagellar protein FlaJ